MNMKVLSLTHINKAYPGVVALRDFSIDFYEGEVHALLGGNGAGKSTLIKIIAGAIKPDGGQIQFTDEKFHAAMNPKLAIAYGVEVIYQEFNLVEGFSAAENVFFGERNGWVVNPKQRQKKAMEIFQEFEVDIDPREAICRLTAAKKQVVALARAISKQVKILIMDEPTAPLSLAEVMKMYAVIRRLKARGVSIIYISHRIDELFAISDRITVMRDGEFVATKRTDETNRQELTRLMLGRELHEVYPQREGNPTDILLDVQHLTVNGDEDISFTLRRGEILGLAGLVGAGRTELARLLYGADRLKSGSISIRGKPARIKSPADALRSGIGLIPEDRKQQGCLLDWSVKTNITFSCWNRISKYSVIQAVLEKEIAAYYSSKLQIKASSLDQLVGLLSGGNQQKVALAKILASHSEVLIFDQPTRGIDVAAKQEIYKLMRELADQGKAILMITSDMEELLGMSDRILVLSQGKLSGEIKKPNFSQGAVLELASSNKLFPGDGPLLRALWSKRA
jgi:ribose transport system ATP-binding protein